jgi:hypothetical protein
MFASFKSSTTFASVLIQTQHKASTYQIRKFFDIVGLMIKVHLYVVVRYFMLLQFDSVNKC